MIKLLKMEKSMMNIALLFKRHIIEMKKAVDEDGVELIGYTPWDVLI